MSFSRTAFILFLIFILSPFYTPAFAISEEEKSFLLMYFKEEEIQVISATRSLKSISRIAENVEVVTKEDIELMNAHTVADVLNKVNGVQINNLGGPSSFAFAFIQGSAFRHVAVFMDGILINLFSDNVADIGMIPVQPVEKIEVIKGPASSVWGSSLGGVINIITKSGGNKEGSRGTLYASYGEQSFHDLRAEIYGKKDKIGYYFYAGRTGADGFRGLPDHSGNGFNDYYLKISHDLSNDGDVELTTFYNVGRRGEGNPGQDFLDDKRVENLFATLSFKTALADGIKLYISARSAMRDWKYNGETISDNSLYTAYHSRDNNYGASAKVTANLPGHALVAGVDYDSGVVHIEDPVWEVSQGSKIRRFAAYVNDTIALGKFSITPGVRYDNDNVIDNFVSPSLGVTYELYKNTLLRAFVSRGFSSPPSPWATDTIPYGYKGNPGLEPEKVWSYQLGVETGVLKYFWLKTAVFHHDISNVINENKEIVGDPVYVYTVENEGKARRQGVEVEIRTLPFFHFTLSAGATFIEARNVTTDETLLDVPKYTYDIGVKYDDEKSLKALLTAHYIWWNSTKAGKYDSFVFDFNASKRIYSREKSEAELFFTVHNIFDGKQHINSIYLNPDRWVEGGLRLKF